MRPIASIVLSLAVAVPAVAAGRQAIDRAVASPLRDARLVARDPARHPRELLSFYGVTPRSTVVEIWPGGGYWTQILAPMLYDHGTYYAAMGAKGGTRVDAEFATLSPALAASFSAAPDSYGHIRYTSFGHGFPDLAPANSADVVLTFRNLHNWMGDGDAPEMLAAIHRALKPGGILGVEDHRARPVRPQDPTAANGYIRQDYAIATIERAGFKLVGTSEIAANPKDTTDWPGGVWTLPPTYRLGETDRARYAAIGEADSFELKFRKTG
ncbi:class I SAM-dependent methyltransferase [Sphingomonas bacterium]|uniref:class I SAM-dependent methyltransferase n=1 Tax=Sphingomonas bacterium TaxID=1895847 RepID=UPI0020C607FF|nr:methyltransferase domain-containing protein [Sphingomonas bacterium]